MTCPLNVLFLYSGASNATPSDFAFPQGFAAPFTLKAKKLLQDLCKDEKLGWDDELLEPYRNRWENSRSTLRMLERILVSH